MTDIIDKVLEGTCDFFEIKEEAFYGHCTSDELSMARYYSWHYLHVTKKIKIKVLTERFHRTHDSIYKGIAKMKKMLTLKPYASAYKDYVEHIKKQEREQ